MSAFSAVLISSFFVLTIRCAMVATPMRTHYDQLCKQMMRIELEVRGPIETDAEVAADTRRIDLWFTRDPTRGPMPDRLGLLGRIASDSCTFEFFHNTPSGDELADCLIKHGEFRRFLSLRGVPPPVPIQWVISSGRPDSGIDGLWLRPMQGWPPGFYEGPPLLWTRLVVVNELPVARDTLLLRLCGAGAVLRQAIAELKELPADAPERTRILPILLRLRLTVPSDPAKQTTDDQEFLMDTQDIVETWRREAIQEGIVQGREEGVKEGVARSLVALYKARFGAMPEDLRAVVEDTDDEPTLLTWLLLTGTGNAEEISAAIRSSRPS